METLKVGKAIYEGIQKAIKDRFWETLPDELKHSLDVIEISKIQVNADIKGVLMFDVVLEK